MLQPTTRHDAENRARLELACDQCRIPVPDVEWCQLACVFLIPSVRESLPYFIERILKEKADQDEALRIAQLSQWPMVGANLHYAR